MNFVSPTENIMLKIGPTRITSAVVLDRRPELATLLRQIGAIVEHVPGLRTKFEPFWLWHVRKPAPFDPSHHVAVLDDARVTSPDHLEGLLERTRCLALPADRPPWLMVVVNAERSGNASAAGLPALLFHFDHSIADGIRALEVVTRLPGDPLIAATVAAADPEAYRPRAPMVKFDDLPADARVGPLPLVCMSIDLPDLKETRLAGHDLSDQVIAAIDMVLNDGALFDQNAAKSGKVALVRLTQRRVGVRQLGNHVSVVDREAVAEQAQAATRRGMLPSLEAERTTQARQVWLSPFAGSFTRMMTRQWYARFDALLTIIPGGRDLKSFADTPIDRIYGVAPFLADIPLNIAAITYGDRVSLTLLAKNRFLGDKALLRRRFQQALASGGRYRPIPAATADARAVLTRPQAYSGRLA